MSAIAEEYTRVFRSVNKDLTILWSMAIDLKKRILRFVRGLKDSRREVRLQLTCKTAVESP